MGLSDHTPHRKSRSVCMYVCVYIYALTFVMEWNELCHVIKLFLWKQLMIHDQQKKITDEDIR